MKTLNFTIALLVLSLMQLTTAFANTCEIQERQYIPQIDYAFVTNYGAHANVELNNWRECFFMATFLSKKIPFTSEFDGKIQVTRPDGGWRQDTYEGKMATVHYLYWSFDGGFFASNSSGSVTAYTLSALKNDSQKGDQLFYQDGKTFSISEYRHQW